MTETEFNRHRTPPGGWAFRQASTGWSAPTPIASTFDQTVQLIVKHRKQNPAITAKFKLPTDPEAVASELERYTRKRLGLPEEATAPPFSDSHSTSENEAAGAVADKWKVPRQMATGVATLGDWLGEGAVPVTKEVSENRASICVVCPQNKKGDLMSFFTKPVASLIQKQIEEKNQLKLSTSKDDQLGVCDACGCPLKLKVHVPLEIIKARIKQPELSKLDARCWILQQT